MTRRDVHLTSGAQPIIMHRNGIWTVPLAESHAPYNSVELKREFSNDDNYTAVIVNVAAFMACFELDVSCYVIPAVESWSIDKREGIRDLLNPSTGAPYMPRVSMRIDEKRRFWGLLKPTHVVVASFANGRHRARYLQFAGATCMPVETTIQSAKILMEHCGCI